MECTSNHQLKFHIDNVWKYHIYTVHAFHNRIRCESTTNISIIYCRQNCVVNIHIFHIYSLLVHNGYLKISMSRQCIRNGAILRLVKIDTSQISKSQFPIGPIEPRAIAQPYSWVSHYQPSSTNPACWYQPWKQAYSRSINCQLRRKMNGCVSRTWMREIEWPQICWYPGKNQP